MTFGYVAAKHVASTHDDHHTTSTTTLDTYRR
jgi:hypothetical protein